MTARWAKISRISAVTGEFDLEVSLAELEELAATAGAEVVAKMTQNPFFLSLILTPVEPNVESTARLYLDLTASKLLYWEEVKTNVHY